MRAIKAKHTRPEMAVRALVWAAGYRYRLHAAAASARPDLVFKGRRKAIFVHGCFWHQHEGCRRSHVPLSRSEYWRPKLDRNKARDAEQQAALAGAGWEVAVVWECELKRPEAVSARLRAFLGDPPARRTGPRGRDPHGCVAEGTHMRRPDKTEEASAGDGGRAADA